MKKRNLLAGLLTAASLTMNGAIIPAHAETTQLPFSAEFEDWTMDNGKVVPAGSWYYVSDRGVGTTGDMVTKPDGDKYTVFKFVADSKDYFMRKDNFGDIAKELVLEEKIKFTSTGNARHFVLPIWDIANTRALTLQFRNGAITASTGSGDVAIDTFYANTWYNVRLVLHPDENNEKITSYDVYLNDALKAKGLSMQAEIAVDKIAPLFSTAYAGGDVMIDSFKVYEKTNDFTEFKLKEGFEDIDAGELVAGTLKLPGYLAVNSFGSNDAAVVEEESGNKLLRLYDKGTNNANLIYSFNAKNEKPVIFQAKIQPSSSGVLMRHTFFSSKGNTGATIQMDGGKVKYNNTVVDTYDTSKVMNLKFKIYADGNTETNDNFDMFINDRLVASGSFVDMTNMSNYRLQFGYANGQHIDVDDIMIYDAPETDAIAFEDFTYCPAKDVTEIGFNSNWAFGGVYHEVNKNEIKVCELNGDNVLKVKTEAGTGSQAAVVSYNNLNLTGRLSIEQSLYVNRYNTRVIPFGVYDSRGRHLTLWMDGNGIAAYDGADIKVITSGGIPTGVWLKLKIVVSIDGDAQTEDYYDVYLNDELKFSGLKVPDGGLDSALKSIQLMDFQACGYESLAYVDNFAIKSVPETSLKGKISFVDATGVGVDELYAGPGESVKVTADVENNTLDSFAPILYVAMYDNGVLTSVQSASFESDMLPNTKDSLGITITNPDEVSTLELKAFLWDGQSTMKPVAKGSLKGSLE